MARKTITLSKGTFDRFNSAASSFENGSQSGRQIQPPNRITPATGGKNFWIGQIVDEGPDSEADYGSGTNLYWIKKLYEDDTTADTAELTVDIDLANPIHITATDLTNSSRLPPDSIVQVYWSRNKEGIIKHYFFAGGGGSSIIPLKIDVIENDYLICNTWDGTTLGTTDIYVAKPYLLQQISHNYPWIDTSSLTTINDQTVTVEVMSVQFTWQITPPYAEGEVIWATPTTLDDIAISPGVYCSYVDLNTNGHAWAEEA